MGEASLQRGEGPDLVRLVERPEPFEESDEADDLQFGGERQGVELLRGRLLYTEHMPVAKRVEQIIINHDVRFSNEFQVENVGDVCLPFQFT